MLNQFKQHYKLFYPTLGWVIFIKENKHYPTIADVILEDKYNEILKDLSKLTQDAVLIVDVRLLSYTEYTLQGFTKERPVELPEIGEVGYFWDDNMIGYVCGIYKGISDIVAYPYWVIVRKDKAPSVYQRASKTPPKL